MLHTVYLLSVFLHILAAVVWIGGTIFFVIVLVPVIRRPEVGANASLLIRLTGLRFRWVGWACFIIFILTGFGNLAFRSIGPAELGSALFWQTSFGAVLALKLVLVAVILLMSAVHDFFIGPRAAVLWRDNPASAVTQRFRRYAVQLGRLNLLLALIVIVLGIMLVRGVPW